MSRRVPVEHVLAIAGEHTRYFTGGNPVRTFRTINGHRVTADDARWLRRLGDGSQTTARRSTVQNFLGRYGLTTTTKEH